MAVSKKVRQQVYEKYDGRCAYTGRPLPDDWEPDHVQPKFLFEMGFIEGDPDHIDNLLPSLKIVNRYKGALSLKSFREWYLGGLHERLAKLPKNPKVMQSKNRKARLNKIADLFDIAVEKPFSGQFYFEKIKP